MNNSLTILWDVVRPKGDSAPVTAAERGSEDTEEEAGPINSG